MSLIFKTSHTHPHMRITLLLLLPLLILSCSDEQATYVCKPCNLACDDLTFDGPGQCPHCQMDLVKRSEWVADSPKIAEGSGYFALAGEAEGIIPVFYHRPEGFMPSSPVLLVIPGAGRNAERYRDAWVEESERYGVLILTPLFPERHYPFEDYHLCRLVEDSNLQANVTYVEGTNMAQLDEDNFEFALNGNAEEWIFHDIDRIFEKATAAVGSTRTRYDLFGHSAGGHILHRLALFGESDNINRIVAANASFYTVPTFDVDFPFGLRHAPIDSAGLSRAFERKLVLLLGENDDETETKGTLLRSETADKQGLHRLARGRHFFMHAREAANSLGLAFNWELAIVPGIGHDHRLMGDAAAEYLYGNTRHGN